jgi:hypothetical protein
MLFDKINLEPEEAILKTVRMHWFIITIELVSIVLVGLVPFFLVLSLFLLPIDSPVRTLFADNFLYFLFGSCLWMIMTVLAAISAWTHYFLDLWVVTDRRIIVIDQVHFFNRKVSNFRLERLQDIKVNVSGILPTLLNYGTLRAQTASAAESNFTSPALPAPRELQALIQTAMDARLAKLNNRENHTNID